MNEELKKQTNGGIAPMAMWVGAMCASTLISTVVNGICTLSSQAHANDSTSSGSSSNSSKYVTNKSTGYLRISPYPNRSSFMMDI